MTAGDSRYGGAGTAVNRFGQPVGPSLSEWTSPEPPTPIDARGRTCHVVDFDVEAHTEPLFEAYSVDDGSSFTYLPFEQPASPAELAAVIGAMNAPSNQSVCAILVDDRPLGMASFLRIDTTSGSVEVGGICFSPALARTTAATEAMFLMADHAFTLGYRRYEWKCDSLNEASNAAALRLGFRFEGMFRNALVYKGRSRNTNWLSILDTEWPERRAALVEWLDPSNFDNEGHQRRSLRR
ncbi:MAG: GNAT family N-acetyltransferase [Microthrixaceae bacterium]|nr:GNAT family N-acetyltransferase [Microthrixaceae bacterium]